MYICKCNVCAKNNRVLNYAITCTYDNDNNQDECRLVDNDNWNECRLAYNNVRMNVISNLNSV
jgi:hypothetical protein